MKRSIKCLLMSLIFLISGISGLCPITYTTVQAAVQATYYVSPTGDDNNPGTLQEPFATIQKARDAVASINSDMTGDIIVYLRGGTYTQTGTLSFDQYDSGTNGYEIKYEAFPGEEPVISGGQRVTGWSRVGSSSIFEANVALERIRQMYVDSKRAQRARSEVTYTGNGWYDDVSVTESVYDGIYVDDYIVGDFQNEDDMELHWEVEWKSYYHKVENIIDGGGGQKIIMLQQPYFSLGAPEATFSSISAGAPFYIENAFELLDAPGEWYFNRSTGKLYYWPRDGEDLNVSEVYVPAVERLVEVKGVGVDEKAENLQFTGITFEYATWLFPDETGCIFHQAGGYIPSVGSGTFVPPNIYVEYAKNINCTGNIIRHMGATAIGFRNSVTGSSIIGNYIYDISEGAVSIGKYHKLVPLPADEEVCSDILVKNNLIRQTGMEYFSSVAIIGYITDHLEITHNDIYDNPYTGISVGWGWQGGDIYCSDNNISYNKISNVMKRTRDGGGIYTLSNQPNSVIHGNYIVNTFIRGDNGAIYPDQYTRNIIITGNVVENVLTNWLYIWRTECENILVDNNFTNNSSYVNVGSACRVDNTHYYPDADWPPEALEIIGKAGLEDEYAYLLYNVTSSENLAVFKHVSAGSSLENGFWSAGNVVDGHIDSINESNIYSNGYSSNAHPYQNSNEWVEIDLGTNQDINLVKLYPRTDEEAYEGGSAGFPVDFTIQVKPDGGAYSMVKTVTGQCNPYGEPQTYYLGSQNARYIKINATRLGTPARTEIDNFRLQFAEIEVYNDTAVSSWPPSSQSYGDIYIPPLPPSGNIARGKTVTVSSVSTGNTVYEGNYGSRAVDGKSKTIWSSGNNLFNNHTEWINVDLGKKHAVSRVDLYPRSNIGEVGEGFPVDFTIQVSGDNTNWSTVVTQTGYPKPDENPQTFTFAEKSARYIRVAATALRKNTRDNTYRFQLDEIEIFGQDLALNKAVTASSSQESAGWGCGNTVDGKRKAAGWTSTGELAANHTEWIKLDLGENRDISQVDIYPRCDTGNVGQGFPVDFTIQTSSDNLNWNTVVSKAGYALPEDEVQRFAFNSQNARYVKIEGTSLRPNPNDNNYYRMQFYEIEAYDNGMSLNKDVTASSSVNSFSWGVESLADGIRNTAGWSSNNSLTTNHTEWVKVDLRKAYEISRVDLYPRCDTGNVGQGFPVDFTIKVSQDGVNWTTVVTKTGYPLPENKAQSFAFGNIRARFVMMEGTSLRQNANDNNYYRMQFNELQVYGRNLAYAGTASSSSQASPYWTDDNAFDGNRTSAGWSSNSSLAVNHTEWIKVDLGAEHDIAQVNIFPRSDAGNAGYGFPVDFKIQVSQNDLDWTAVAAKTDYALPAGVQSFAFDEINARYVRIVGTSLRQNPEDNNYYRMQFMEIEIP